MDYWSTNDGMEALATDLEVRAVTWAEKLHNRWLLLPDLRCRCGEPQSGVKYMGELFFRGER